MVLVTLEDDWRVIEVDVDVHSSDAEVYYALRKLLRRNKAESHLVCDELVVTAENACSILRAESLVRVVDGAAPKDGRVAPASRARLTAPGVKTEKHEKLWLPKAHRGARPRQSGERAYTLHAQNSALAATAASTGIAGSNVGTEALDAATNSDLSDWISSYESEVETFTSTVLNAELRYEEVLAATAGLGKPNAARTRVACQLLQGVVRRFGRFEHIATRLLDDIFASVFVDPETPDALPYFLKYGQTSRELRQLQARFDLVSKSNSEHEAASEKRMAYIKRTMQKFFKGQDLTAFRQWREHVRKTVESRAMVTKLIAKWRRQDTEKRRGDAWQQWCHAVDLYKQERREGALEKLTLQHERTKQALVETEAERDSALNEVAQLQADVSKLRAELADARRETAAQVVEMEKVKAQTDVFRTVATEYRRAMSEAAKSRARMLKGLAEKCVAVDVGRMHAAGELDARGLAPVDMLLRWINCHLEASIARPVANLSSDMRNGATMYALMRALNPVVTVVSAQDATSEGDTGGDEEGDAAKAAAEAATETFGFPPGCLAPEDLSNPAMNLALSAYLMSYEHGLAVYPPEYVLGTCKDLQNAAGYLVGRSIDEEIGADGSHDVEVLQNLERAIKEADAAVRDLHSERAREKAMFESYSRDVMTFALGALIQTVKGVQVDPPIASAEAEAAEKVAELAAM